MCNNNFNFVECVLLNLSPFELCTLLHHLLQWFDNLGEIWPKSSYEVDGSHERLHPLFIMGQGDLFNGLDSFRINRDSLL